MACVQQVVAGRHIGCEVRPDLERPHLARDHAGRQPVTAVQISQQRRGQPWPQTHPRVLDGEQVEPRHDEDLRRAVR
jgi:hypothetical protein